MIRKSDIELSTTHAIQPHHQQSFLSMCRDLQWFTTLIPNWIYQIGSLGILAKLGQTFVLQLFTYMLSIYVWMGDSTTLSVAVRRFIPKVPSADRCQIPRQGGRDFWYERSILDLTFTPTSLHGHETWERKKKEVAKA